MEDILRINPTGKIPERNKGLPGFKRRKKKKKKNHQYVKGHLDDLNRIADEADRALEQMNSPFRIRIYEQEGEVFIDIVTLDDYGRVTKVFHQDITHEELEDLIRHLKSGRGLVFDARA